MAESRWHRLKWVFPVLFWMAAILWWVGHTHGWWLSEKERLHRDMDRLAEDTMEVVLGMTVNTLVESGHVTKIDTVKRVAFVEGDWWRALDDAQREDTAMVLGGYLLLGTGSDGPAWIVSDDETTALATYEKPDKLKFYDGSAQAKP